MCNYVIIICVIIALQTMQLFIARTQYKANDIRFEMSNTQVREQLKQLKQMQTSFSNNITNISSI